MLTVRFTLTDLTPDDNIAAGLDYVHVETRVTGENNYGNYAYDDRSTEWGPLSGSWTAGGDSMASSSAGTLASGQLVLQANASSTFEPGDNPFQRAWVNLNSQLLVSPNTAVTFQVDSFQTAESYCCSVENTNSQVSFTFYSDTGLETWGDFLYVPEGQRTDSLTWTYTNASAVETYTYLSIDALAQSSASMVPEPATYGMLGAGLVLLAARGRRFRQG